MEEIISLITRTAGYRQLLARLREQPDLTCSGLPPGTLSILAGNVTRDLNLPVILLCETTAVATLHEDELAGLYPELIRLRFDPSSPLLRTQLAALQPPAVIIADAEALEAPAPAADADPLTLTLNIGQTISLPELAQWFEDNGYERTDLVTEPGEYAIRGGIADCFPPNSEEPLRIELVDNTIDSLRIFDPLTQRSVPALPAAASGNQPSDLKTVFLFTRRSVVTTEMPASSLLPREAVAITSGPRCGSDFVITVSDSPAADYDLGFRAVVSYLGNIGLLRSEIEADADTYYVVISGEHQRERTRTLLGHTPRYLKGLLGAGFCHPGLHITVLTEREIYGTPVGRPARRRFKGLPVDNLVALRPGDYVVHIDYGIGLFEGTRRLTHDNIEKDYLVIRYAGSDRVYVPVENLGLLDRYTGGDDEPPPLDRLGGRSWLLAKSRAARASAEYARELLDIQARRELARRTPFPADTPEQTALEASFPYPETPDQLKAINDVKRDMQSARPMDRLVCGDVGFGKTEVALRAAFKAAMNARQVALLCPTTILAFQHFTVFQERLAPFPLRVGMLSRFVSRRERQQTLNAIANGAIDIVIGTHALLNPAVRFRDLGLVIIDEEQRFGVRQKESLRALKSGVDVLTLSATPIPRTLYIALAGLRDISAIHTPPPGRHEIATEVAHWHDSLIRDYVCRELNRGGQVFFVHNEILSIGTIADRLNRLLPGARIAVAHGQLSEQHLAEIYLNFAAGKSDILLSTAIIESGLDMPRVNTIIVNRADRFGLADLHQLRGRVGRSRMQAYALFLVPDRHDVTLDARKRLSALLAYSQLGAGYKLALRDMEIRGVGNLLGTEQHGHIARIGFSLYTQLLREAVAELKGEKVAPEPEFSLELSAFIPREYVADQYERVALYKRLLAVQTEEELAAFKAELVDRFGRYPEPVQTLLKVALVRIRARHAGLLKVRLNRDAATLVWPDRSETFSGGIDLLLAHLTRDAG